MRNSAFAAILLASLLGCDTLAVAGRRLPGNCTLQPVGRLSREIYSFNITETGDISVTRVHVVGDVGFRETPEILAFERLTGDADRLGVWLFKLRFHDDQRPRALLVNWTTDLGAFVDAPYVSFVMDNGQLIPAPANLLCGEVITEE